MAKTEPTTAIALDQTEAKKNPNQETVPLDSPLQRGEQSITGVIVRKPMSGELRGVALQELLSMDVLALRKVLPRITTPSLTDHELGRMDPADLVQLGVAVTGFLVQKRFKEEASLTA